MTKETRWVFLVDTHKCVGCGFCVKACKLENEVPYDANVTRTWVERYVITKDRQDSSSIRPRGPATALPAAQDRSESCTG